MTDFYIGLHNPASACHFPRVMLSINRLRTRRKALEAERWILDSGAFTELLRYGAYRHSVAEYAEHVKRWSQHPGLVAAVSQDFMCEPFILAKTGLDVAAHQHLTIARYDELRTLVPDAPLMPVIQGYAPQDYATHTRLYGDRFSHAAWVGVGSVCKRNGSPDQVVSVLLAIKEVRPDLRLHGFGIKLTALRDDRVRGLLASADSAAWSYAGRRSGEPRRANDWHEAERYRQRVETALADGHQPSLFSTDQT